MDWFIEQLQGLDWKALIVGILLSELVSLLIGFRFITRKRVRLEIKDIFVLPKYKNESFRSLELALVDEENPNKRLTGDILLATFRFVNTGNLDIRMLHKDEELGFQLEKPCKILRVEDEEDFSFDAKSGKIKLERKVLKAREIAEVDLAIKYPGIGESITESDLRKFVTVKNSIDNLKPVVSGELSYLGFFGIFLVASFILSFFVAAYLCFLGIANTGGLFGDFPAGIMLAILGCFFAIAAYRGARRNYQFRRRQIPV